MSWLQIKRLITLNCHLLLFCTAKTNHFLIWLYHETESRFYMTTSDDQLSGWTKKKLQSTSQSQTCTKKRSWSLFGGVWSTTAFWILAKPLSLRSMLSKLMGCTKTAMTAASIGQQKGPTSSPWQRQTACCTTNTAKVEPIGLQSFASSVIFTWSFANHLPLLQTSRQLFAGKILPQPAGCGKCFHHQKDELSKSSWILKHGFLCYRNKSTYFLLAKMCWF